MLKVFRFDFYLLDVYLFETLCNDTYVSSNVCAYQVCMLERRDREERGQRSRAKVKKHVPRSQDKDQVAPVADNIRTGGAPCG